MPLGSAIASSFLSLPVEPNDVYPDIPSTQYMDLEEKGLIKLENGIVKIPHFFVWTCLTSSRLPFAASWKNLLFGEDVRWEDWEKFNQNYLAFRLLLFKHLGYKTVPLKQFFSGAQMNIPEDLEIEIPKNIQVSKANNQYPTTTTPNFGDGNCVLNVPGAPFDAFTYLRTKTGDRLLLALQMKWANLDSTYPQVIRQKTTEEEFEKIEDSVRNHLPGVDFVCVLLSRCKGMPFKNSNFDYKYVIVSLSEFEAFYGASYYQRFNCDLTEEMQDFLRPMHEPSKLDI
jgi:hypothetical protein